MMGNQVKSLSSRRLTEVVTSDRIPMTISNPSRTQSCTARCTPKVLSFAPVHHAAHQYGTDNARQKDKVVHAFQLLRAASRRPPQAAVSSLFAVIVGIENKVNHQQYNGNHQPCGAGC